MNKLIFLLALTVISSAFLVGCGAKKTESAAPTATMVPADIASKQPPPGFVAPTPKR